MEHQVYEQMAAVEADHWWYRSRRRIFSSVLKRFVSANPDIALDFGCGTGGNFALLNFCHHVFGVDAHPESVSRAAEKAPVVRYSDVEGWPVATNAVDLISAFDVIEHIDDDLKAMKMLRFSLKPAGRMIVSVPAYQWLWSEHDERLHHKRRYTAAQLREVGVKAGFELEYLTYHNSLLLPLSILLRLLSRVTRGKLAVNEDRVPHPLINKTLEIFYASESHLIKRGIRLPFGLSVLAVFTKIEPITD